MNARVRMLHERMLIYIILKINQHTRKIVQKKKNEKKESESQRKRRRDHVETLQYKREIMQITIYI